MERIFLISLILLLLLNSCDNNLSYDQNLPDIPEEEKKQILFLSDRETSRNQIYLMNYDGTDQRRISRDSIDYAFASFSPCGKKILAHSRTWNNSDEIYLLDLSGKIVRNLSDSPGDDNLALFSPEGSLIVFTSNRYGNREIFVMDTLEYNQRRITFDEREDHSPQFISETEILYYTVDLNDKSYNLYIIDIFGENKRCLTEGNIYRHNTSWLRDRSGSIKFCRPVISGDGSKVAFTSYNESIDNFSLHLINIDGSGARLLSNLPGHNVSPVFVNNDSSIIYMSHRTGVYDLFKVSLNTLITAQITENLGHVIISEISPNKNKLLLFADPVALCFNIWVINTDGSGLTQLTNGMYNDYFPQYQPQ